MNVGHFEFILFGILCTFWTCMSVSFTRLGKFYVIIFSHRFLIPCSVSSLSVTPMMQMLVHLNLSQRLFTLSSFLLILFSFCCLDWGFFSFFLSSKLLIWSSASSTLLILCNEFSFQLFHSLFLTGSLCFLSPFYFSYLFVEFMLSSSTLPISSLRIHITSVLNSEPVFWTLNLVDWLSPFYLFLFLEFRCVLSFGVCFFVLLILAASLCLFLSIR